VTCPRCNGPVGDEPCLDHHPACPRTGCTCPTVCPACCDCARVFDPVTLPERVSSKIRPNPDPLGCWTWTGAISSGTGYGGVRYQGRQLGAHRVVYELLVGVIPDGLQLDHLCRNRACVNPAHLEPVTGRVNVLRGISPAAKVAGQTHCGRGHEFSPENTYVTPAGSRQCQECRRIRNRRRYWQLKEAKAAATTCHEEAS
jgi:hypothetical protein